MLKLGHPRKSTARRSVSVLELVRRVCYAKGAPRHIVEPIIEQFMSEIGGALSAGMDVKLRRLGTFKWVHHGGKKSGAAVYPPGRRLRFVPSAKVNK